MVYNNTNRIPQSRMDIPVAVGDSVTIFGEEEQEILFQDIITQYVPQTGLLRFENSHIGRGEFRELLTESGGIQIKHNSRDTDEC